jgi:thiamine pyrophosphate-dependent acetolactate synthase large subunit-like protein
MINSLIVEKYLPVKVTMEKQAISFKGIIDGAKAMTGRYADLMTGNSSRLDKQLLDKMDAVPGFSDAHSKFNVYSINRMLRGQSYVTPNEVKIYQDVMRRYYKTKDQELAARALTAVGVGVPTAVAGTVAYENSLSPWEKTKRDFNRVVNGDIRIERK